MPRSRCPPARWLRRKEPAADPWTFDFILRLLGADVGVGYRGLSFDPRISRRHSGSTAGGGYEGEHYYRDAAGNLLSPGEIGPSGSLPNADPSFNRIEGAWRLGIEQGFAWNPRTSTNLLEGFLFYRGRYDSEPRGEWCPAHHAVAQRPAGPGRLLPEHAPARLRLR